VEMVMVIEKNIIFLKEKGLEWSSGFSIEEIII
jgi:hypothetical protein